MTPNPKNQTKPKMKTQEFPYLQVITCRMALKMAAESNGQMHLTNPVLVRRIATQMLTALGVQGVTNRTRWKTLHDAFEATIGKELDAEKAEESKNAQPNN